MSTTLSRALGRVLTAAVLAAVALVPAAGAASAHDRLVDSSPSSDQRLDAAPAEIRLDYSDDIMDVGAAVIVADQDGADWATGEPVLDGPTVTVPVDPALPDGAYTVRWRVVSSDGHAISGAIPFTVGDAAAVSAPTATAEPTAAVDPTAADPTAVDSTAVDPTEAASPLRTVLIALGGAAVAVGLYALVLWLRRRAARRQS